MKPVVFAFILVTVPLSSTPTFAQRGPVLPPRDVVILALGANDSGDEGVLRAAMKLAGQRLDRSTLRDIQLDIVRKTAPFGPVLLLAPNDDLRSEVASNCSALDLCKYLADGTVRIIVVPHDTEWIRDYGPLIESDAKGVRVVDSAYHDVRQDDRINEVLQGLLEKRLELLKHALASSDGEERNIFEMEPDEEEGGAVESRIRLLKEFSEALRESVAYGQRPIDDRAPFNVAQAVLAQPGFSLVTTKLFVDGGNLLKLEDGACLTTKDLHTRNPDRHNELAAELRGVYNCSDIVFLESLPGPVIEHVDMFVLPVRGKRLILPNFGLDQPHISANWKNMNELERDLTLQAALTIERNTSILRGRGYDVSLVPAVTPQASSSGRVFYPTMLNALVRSNGLDSLQVLVPVYKGLQEQVQKEVLEKIEADFGPAARVVPIEATVAARGQGAVHCLTVTAPFGLSIFSAGLDLTARRMTELRNTLDAANRLLTNPRLIGTWSTSRAADTRAKQNSIPITATFSDDGKIRLTIAGEPRSGSYRVVEAPNMSWPLEIDLIAPESPRKSPQEGAKIVARIEWVTDTLFRLVLTDGDAITMRRVLPLSELDTGGRNIVVGSVQKGVLRDSDDRDADGSLVQAWALNGRAGEAVKLDIISDTFDTVVTVVGPGLTRPMYDDDSGDDLNASLIVQFPETGTYKVIIQGAENNATGDFVIRTTIRDTATATRDWASDTLIGVFRTIPVQRQRLDVGRRLNAQLVSNGSPEISGHPAMAWTLEGCDGGRVRIVAKSDKFDTVLLLFGAGSDEMPLLNDDDNDSSDSALEFVCNKRTPYRVVVSSYDKNEVGPFSVEATFVRR